MRSGRHSPSRGDTVGLRCGALWRPTPRLSVQWRADGTAIEGATSEQFRLTGRWKGSDITVEVTAALEGYDRTTVRSAPVRIS